jgi:hypothetical protein
MAQDPLKPSEAPWWIARLGDHCSERQRQGVPTSIVSGTHTRHIDHELSRIMMDRLGDHWSETTLDKYRQVLIMYTHTRHYWSELSRIIHDMTEFQTDEAPWWCSTRRPHWSEKQLLLSTDKYWCVTLTLDTIDHELSRSTDMTGFSNRAKRHDELLDSATIDQKDNCWQVPTSDIEHTHTRQHCDHELSRDYPRHDGIFRAEQRHDGLCRLGDHWSRKKDNSC